MSVEDRIATVWTMLVDRFGAEMGRQFEDAGIEAMVVKGPAIGEWLYADGSRTYGDVDLFVRATDWNRSVALLEDHGFQDVLGPVAHPRMESQAGTAFKGDGPITVDLHCTLAGLDASPEAVGVALFSDARHQLIAGRETLVPGRAAVLLHIALHAVHHLEGKPVTDLERALEIATEEEWRGAAALAHELDGLAAFATGLRLVPAGAALAKRLDVDEQGSVHFDLRAAQIPTAEGLGELFAPGLRLRDRLSILYHELFPSPEFMRWWTSLAHRGRRGLVASYVGRWLWLLVKIPRGLRALLTVRRRHRA